MPTLAAPPRPAPRPGMTAAERRLLLLLVASIFINYIDRGSLSIAAPLLEKELSLTPSQLGNLLGSFFWTYALLQLFGVAGWLADRFPVAAVLAGGFFVWSAATAAGGLVTGFGALFVTRLVLGAAESVAYPCYSKVLAAFPQHYRGLANSLLDAGSKLGPALGTYLGGLLIAEVGWRVFFLVLGVGGLVWLVPWLLWMPRLEAETRVRPESAPSVGDILRCRSAYGTFLGHFCGNYFWFFLLTWLPSYLVRARGLTLQGMASIGSVAYLAIAVATVVAGWLTDRRIAAGVSPTRARKTAVVLGLSFSTIILPVAFVDDRTASVALLFLACLSFGVFTSNHWAITQTLAGPLAAGRWTSIQNGVGNLAGIAAAWLTGQVVERTGSFHLAFAVSAGVALCGAAIYAFVVGPVEPVRWRGTGIDGNGSSGRANGEK